MKVFPTGRQAKASWVINGLSWIKDTVGFSRSKAVINISIQSTRPSVCIQNVIKHLGARIPIVSCAGNKNTDACRSSAASAGGNQGPGITVAASDVNDNMASFSNYGFRCVDVIAPGVRILSAGSTGTDATAVGHGTSYSAPYVAGIIARFMAGMGITDPDS